MRRRSLFRSFPQQEEAASLAEYALLLGVIAVALLLVISQFSGSVSNLFARTTNMVAQIGNDAPAGSGTSGTGSTGGGSTGGGSTGGVSTVGGQGSGTNGNRAGQGNNGSGSGNSGSSGNSSGGKKP